MFDQILLPFVIRPEVSVPCLGAGHTLQGCQGGIHPGAAWTHQFAQLAQSPSGIYPLFQKSQSQTPQLPHPWNASFKGASRQLLLQHTLGIHRIMEGVELGP